MRKPNYTGQDLPITHNTYHNGKLVRQEDGTMDLQPTWGGRAGLLETLKQRELPNNLGKGALVLTQMGEASSGLTVIYGMGWEGNPYTEVAQEEDAEMAHRLRDKDGKMPNIITVPTSALSKSIASEMAQTGSFAALAEELAPTVNDIISNDSDQVAIIGNSWGARLATAMSPVIEDKNKISQVVLEDPPASCESLSITQIASAQLGEAVLHGPRYTKASIDDKAREAWGRINEAEKIATSPLSAWLKSVWAMTKTEGFRTDLDATLDVLTLPESDCVAPVTLVIPELSKMRGKGDPEALMQTVSARYPKADLRLVEVGDSTHNVSVANPAYFGKILELGRK
jgi:hypothetical protein